MCIKDINFLLLHLVMVAPLGHNMAYFDMFVLVDRGKHVFQEPSVPHIEGGLRLCGFVGPADDPSHRRAGSALVPYVFEVVIFVCSST